MKMTTASIILFFFLNVYPPQRTIPNHGEKDAKMQQFVQ